MSFATNNATGGGWRDRLNSKRPNYNAGPPPVVTAPAPAPAAPDYTTGAPDPMTTATTATSTAFDWSSQASTNQTYYGGGATVAAPANTSTTKATDADGWYSPSQSRRKTAYVESNALGIWALILSTVGWLIIVGPPIGGLLAIIGLARRNLGTAGKFMSIIALLSLALWIRVVTL